MIDAHHQKQDPSKHVELDKAFAGSRIGCGRHIFEGSCYACKLVWKIRDCQIINLLLYGTILAATFSNELCADGTRHRNREETVLGGRCLCRAKGRHSPRSSAFGL